MRDIMQASVIKTSFGRFVRELHNEDKSIETFGKKIQNVVIVVNKIVTEGYYLCNLHILRLLEERKSIPVIDQNYIKHFFYLVSKVTNKSGRPQKKMKK
jgi:hypothetical protein